MFYDFSQIYYSSFLLPSLSSSFSYSNLSNGGLKLPIVFPSYQITRAQWIQSSKAAGYRRRDFRFPRNRRVAVGHDGDVTPPFTISFCKSSKSSHVLAVSDEDGYVSLFDTRRQLSSSSSLQENADNARVCEWASHNNAVFDLSWVKGDVQILTASGDQTMKAWDVQEQKCIAVLMGHTGSVKSMSSHPTDPEIVVSGSRDGSFALWDMSCSSSSISRREELCVKSTASVKGAHLSCQAKRVRRGKSASMSITSVLYLKDGISIATAGAVDSIVKFWDTRNMKNAVTRAQPHPDSTDKLEKGPTTSFSGCRIESFFVKSSLSPDTAHILSGSSDGNAYIWKVNKPQEDPIRLESHEGEVTAVDWCPYEDGKIATCSDDFTVCIWNSETRYCSNTRCASVIRRRVMALPGECTKLPMNEPEYLRKDSSSILPDEVSDLVCSVNPITTPKFSSPVTREKRFSLDSDLKRIP